jgi:hypothetical protein
MLRAAVFGGPDEGLAKRGTFGDTLRGLCSQPSEFATLLRA